MASRSAAALSWATAQAGAWRPPSYVSTSAETTVAGTADGDRARIGVQQPGRGLAHRTGKPGHFSAASGLFQRQMTWFTTSDQSKWQAGNGMKIIPELMATGGNPQTPQIRASRSWRGLRRLGPRPARKFAAAAAVGAAVAATTLATPAYAATTMTFHSASSSSLGPGANASNGEIIIGSTATMAFHSASSSSLGPGANASNGDILIGSTATMTFHSASSSSLGPGANASNGDIVIGTA
jgi:hypothetical protein